MALTDDDFKTIEEHDQAIIDRWNAVVKEDDTVFFLGDASMHRIKFTYLKSIFGQLKGKIVWLKGNHDSHVSEAWIRELRQVCNIVEFKDYAEIFFTDETHKTGFRRLVMFHYPIAEWDQMHRGALHFHGHLHGGESGLEAYRARDMGMDATGMIVVEMERAINDAMTGAIKGHHV